MGMAYYPVLNPPISGFKPELNVSGKALAEAMPALDELAQQLSVEKLRSFHSESLEESFALIGESVPADMPEMPIQWFEPERGLNAIKALRDHLGSHAQIPLLLKDAPGREPDQSILLDRVLQDLLQLESVLNAAAQNKSKFRLRIDM
jgi:hypothetical protein